MPPNSLASESDSSTVYPSPSTEYWPGTKKASAGKYVRPSTALVASSMLLATQKTGMSHCSPSAVVTVAVSSSGLPGCGASTPSMAMPLTTVAASAAVWLSRRTSFSAANAVAGRAKDAASTNDMKTDRNRVSFECFMGHPFSGVNAIVPMITPQDAFFERERALSAASMLKPRLMTCTCKG